MRGNLLFKFFKIIFYIFNEENTYFYFIFRKSKSKVRKYNYYLHTKHAYSDSELEYDTIIAKKN